MNWRVLALVVLPGLAGAEELYRWVDEQGNVHLSETPPAGAAAEPWKPKQIETAPAIPSPQQKKAAPATTRPRAGTRLSTPAAPAPKGSGEATIAGRTEAEWRRDALEKQQQISNLEDRIRVVEEMPEFTSTSYKKNAYGEKSVVGGSSKTGMLSSLHHELERAQKSLDDFEDYARQLGVPAGWLR